MQPRLDSKNYHMSPEEFRNWGYQAVDWIANYMTQVDHLPVSSNVHPGDIKAQLPRIPPEKGEAFNLILKDLNDIILPGITHWQSPNFFAFFPAGASAPSILGELMSAGLGVLGFSWETSPACTELETHVLDWLVQMLGLPQHFHSSQTGGGVIQESACTSAVVALVAAREKQNVDINQLVAYASREAHSSIEKAAKIVGLSPQNMRLVEVDSNYSLSLDSLNTLVEADLQAGLTPCFLAATIGTTSSNAIDPILDLGVLSQRHNLWLHIDAAMLGTAALCPEFRWIHQGLELADSYSFNPHKWMMTNFDCNCFYVRDRLKLTSALAMMPEYLKNAATDSGRVIDYRDWQISLARRFRSLKLWFVIRHYGIEGLQHYVRKHVALAQEFAGWVRSHPCFELAVHPPFNLVCFRHQAGDQFNQKLLDTLNQSGKLCLSATKLDNQFVLRMAIGQANTEQLHVERAWQLICQTADDLAATWGESLVTIPIHKNLETQPDSSAA